MNTAIQLTMLAPLVRGLAGGQTAEKAERGDRPMVPVVDKVVDAIVRDASAPAREIADKLAKDPKSKWYRKPTDPNDPAFQLATSQDPYAELKAAWARGEEIETNFFGTGWAAWGSSVQPEWSDTPEHYRVKPAPERKAVGILGIVKTQGIVKHGHCFKVGDKVRLKQFGPTSWNAYLLDGSGRAQVLYDEDWELDVGQ